MTSSPDSPPAVEVSASSRPTPDRPVSVRPARDWTLRHLAALLAANVVLALGPWLVRLADTGPVAAGFWRLAFALPVLVFLAMRESAGQRRVPPWPMLALIVGAGLFFALDLASWHVGIEKTKLGNAALFGNAGSLILMVWGLVVARRTPRVLEVGAILASLAGAAMLMGGSLEVSDSHFLGDLFCLLAGLFYAFYILMLNRARAQLGPFSVLAVATASSLPVILAIALVRGEVIIAQDWTALVVLAMSSQVIGQGLLIYALRHFTPLVIGLALMTQPAIAAFAGWLAFGETLSGLVILGMVLLASALAMARAGDRS